MALSLVLGNGKLFVGLDSYGRVRDLYFPHVGLENQVGGSLLHRVGVHVDGKTSWIGEDAYWQIDVLSDSETFTSVITATHLGLGVSLHFKDIVYNEHAVFIRSVEVTNLSQNGRCIKVYFAHQFQLYRSLEADTAYFDPRRRAIVHYKGQRVFLIYAELDGEPFGDYTTGLANHDHKEGSHRDADDGQLSKNPIEHGPADSVIGLYAAYGGSETKKISYWMAGAHSITEAADLHAMVQEKTPDHIIRTTSDFWKAWVNKYQFNFHELSPQVVELFKKSLMFMRTHVDAGGAIVASGDSSILQQGKDTYAYMWPRDASFISIALDRAGDFNTTKRFFEFCRQVMHPDGYFMHKYRADASLGSSWHPYVRDGEVQLPIQEDETALVLCALWEHYQRTHDIEFVEELYNDLIERAADFMCAYRDPGTGLPKGSYDLWEEKYGTHTFTASAVYGALNAAAEFSVLLGKEDNAEKYRSAAHEIRDAVLKYLYRKESGQFLKRITRESAAGATAIDETVDISSVFGVFYFGVLPESDERLTEAMEQAFIALAVNTDIGGVARYAGDGYYRVSTDVPGNPWAITALWAIQWKIARAQKEEDFDGIREDLERVARYAGQSGVLPEQLDPFTGAHVSATPLTWSHAEFVTTITAYLERLEELGICEACNPVS